MQTKDLSFAPKEVTARKISQNAAALFNIFPRVIPESRDQDISAVTNVFQVY